VLALGVKNQGEVQKTHVAACKGTQLQINRAGGLLAISLTNWKKILVPGMKS
jgi:hypothetical protein